MAKGHRYVQIFEYIADWHRSFWSVPMIGGWNFITASELIGNMFRWCTGTSTMLAFLLSS